MSEQSRRDNSSVTSSLARGETDTTGTYNLVVDEATGGLLVAQAGDWVLSAADIEIGAVEIKNATDDTRATVGANGLYVDVRAAVITSGTITNITDAVAVTGTFWQATQPVSLASVPTHAVTQSGNWDINDISKGTQTNDVKVTLDSEAVVLGAGTATVGKVRLVTATGDEVTDDTTDAVQNLPIETAPTDASKNNPSFALTWTNGELTGLAMTIGGVTYNKTLVWTDGELTAITAWS